MPGMEDPVLWGGCFVPTPAVGASHRWLPGKQLSRRSTLAAHLHAPTLGENGSQKPEWQPCLVPIYGHQDSHTQGNMPLHRVLLDLTSASWAWAV